MEYTIKDTASLREQKRKLGLLLQSGKTIDLATICRVIANYYYRTSHEDSSLNYYKLALTNYEIIRDSFHISYCYFRIGEATAYAGKNYDESLSWHLPAADYFERADEYLMAAYSNYAISTQYKAKHQPRLREQYLNKAIAFNKLARDTLLDIIIIGSDFEDFRNQKKWNALYVASEKMLMLSRLIRQPVFIKVGLLQMGHSLLQTGNPQKAIPFLEESFRTKANTNTAHPEALRLLAVCHIRLNHPAEAEKYMSLYKQASDSIAKDWENDNYQELLVQYETEKKQATIKTLEQENKLKETMAGNQKNFIIGLSAGLAILIISGWIVLRNIRKRQRLEKELQKQQEKFSNQLLQEKEEKMLAEFNKQIAEVQLTALSAQMNPHFIFNCMNSIQKYVLKNEKTKALEFLHNFSDLMRSVLDNSAKTKIGLDEEISMLEKYILLEQQRLDNGFDYRIDIGPDLQTDFFEVPGMIIQPYVENAIWHGLMNKTEKGLLVMKFEKENSWIKCIVEDNGVGRRKAAELERFKSPKRKSYGMTIAQKRLELLKKENITPPEIKVEDLLDTEQKPAGTRITLFIHID